jgi:sugar O-acyltransferase (sialic acid O-acetyltransferase NeuD family)
VVEGSGGDLRDKGGPLVIVGAGELAAIAIEYFRHDSHYEVLAAAVNSDYLEQAHRNTDLGAKVVPLEGLGGEYPPEEVKLFVAIPASRMSRDRRSVFESLRQVGYSFATYVSSRAFVWRNVTIGENCFIFEGNTLQPFTSVGENSILWSGNHIGHRTTIGNHVFMTSHVVVSGYCSVGEHSFLGVNATVNDGIHIAPFTLVGADAHINRDTEAEGIYVGSPARRLEDRSSLDAKL